MDKYKLIAIGNFVVGAIEALISFFVFTTFYPKIIGVYEDFGAPIPPTTHFFPYLVALLAIISITLGLLILLSKTNKEKFYKVGSIYLAISLVLILFFLPGIFAISSLLPMFNMVSVIK